MSLRCPICGKEYFYDRKICQTCEKELINSGLIEIDSRRSQKWNCSIFLDFENLAFGRRKPDEPYYKIASEPNFYDCKPRKQYPWNCNTRFEIREFFAFDSEISQLGHLENTPPSDSIVFEKEKKIPLIYE